VAIMPKRLAWYGDESNDPEHWWGYDGDNGMWKESLVVERLVRRFVEWVPERVELQWGP
jgi:hypothetical protein